MPMRMLTAVGDRENNYLELNFADNVRLSKKKKEELEKIMEKVVREICRLSLVQSCEIILLTKEKRNEQQRRMASGR